MMFNRKNGIVRHNQKLVYKMCKQSEITVFLENLNMSKKSCGFYEKFSNLWKKKKERKIEILKKFKKYFREDKKKCFEKKRKKNDLNFGSGAKLFWEKTTFCGKKEKKNFFSFFSYQTKGYLLTLF